MEQPLLAIQLHNPDRGLSGGHHIIDVRGPSFSPDLPLLCPYCFSPVAADVRQRKAASERFHSIRHLGNDYRCISSEEPKDWIHPLEGLPNTFSDISPSLRIEHDFSDADISKFRMQLTRSTPFQLRHATSITPLVRCMKHFETALSSHPFHLLGSSVTCWRDLFTDVLPSNEDPSKTVPDRRIFHGRLEGEELTKDCRVLFFREQGADRKSMKCITPFTSEEDRLESLLPISFDYQGGRSHDIFVLGSPHLEGKFSASVTLRSRRYVCIMPRAA